MTVQVDFWQLVGLLVAFFGFAFAAGRLLLSQIDRRLEQRFAAVESAANAVQQLERDFLKWQAKLPIDYVRREDYVRGQSILEAKLDGLAVKIENAQLRGLTRGES